VQLHVFEHFHVWLSAQRVSVFVMRDLAITSKGGNPSDSADWHGLIGADKSPESIWRWEWKVEGLVAYLNINGARRLTTRLVKAFGQELTRGLHSTFFDYVSHRIWWTRPKRMQEEFVFCIHDFGGVCFAGKMLMLTNRSTRNHLCLQSSVQFARTLSMS
jgi:hypothetical protein